MAVPYSHAHATHIVEIAAALLLYHRTKDLSIEKLVPSLSTIFSAKKTTTDQLTYSIYFLPLQGTLVGCAGN
ncbi:hypothetical protein, partial [Paenibacillus oryzae]|uniref:hypothetical protein n=1 Tax=Paenibacillus oryzae TaxID=1844972 RepID=UPI001B808E68